MGAGHCSIPEQSARPSAPRGPWSARLPQGPHARERSEHPKGEGGWVLPFGDSFSASFCEREGPPRRGESRGGHQGGGGAARTLPLGGRPLGVGGGDVTVHLGGRPSRAQHALARASTGEAGPACPRTASAGKRRL